MDTYEAQQAIAAAVVASGYHRTFTAAAFGARNLAKLGEELAELAQHFRLPAPLNREFARLGAICRALFDDRDIWSGAGPAASPDDIKHEMADCAVVLLNMAAAYEEAFGEPFDVIAAALVKARCDVGRGVRGTQLDPLSVPAPEAAPDAGSAVCTCWRRGYEISVPCPLHGVVA